MTTHVEAPVSARIQEALAEERPRRVDVARVPLLKAVYAKLVDELKGTCDHWAQETFRADVELGLSTELDDQARLLTELTVAEGMAVAVRQLQEELMREAKEAGIGDPRIAKACGVRPQAIAQRRARLAK